jgi:hypothetical protein
MKSIANFFKGIFSKGGIFQVQNLLVTDALVQMIKNRDFVLIPALLVRSLLEAVQTNKVSPAEIGIEKLQSKIAEVIWLAVNQLAHYTKFGFIDPIALQGLDAMCNKQPLPQAYLDKYRTVFTKKQSPQTPEGDLPITLAIADGSLVEDLDKRNAETEVTTEKKK